VTWRAGVRLPRSGTYHLAAVSPNSSEVRLDGALIRGDFVSNPGVHLLELQTRVESAADSVSLTLGDRELGWMQTYRLMDAPWGLMASLNRPATDVLGTRIDSSIAMAFFDPELGFVAVPNSIVWTGSLIAPRGGAYRMAFAAEDTMHLSVDGVQQDVVTVQPDRWASVGGGSEVQLTAGAHRVEIRLDITHGGREIARWNWVPPLDGGGVDASSTWAVVPPWVLRPSH
jgi:hypothetical protein